MRMLQRLSRQFGYIHRHATKPAVCVHGAIRQLSSTEYIVTSQNPDIHIPDNVSLPELLTARVQKFTDRVALIDSVTGSKHTYADFLANSERVASALRRRGLEKNDVVCIYAGNSTDFVYLMMGAIQAGGVVTTVNPTYTTNELLYQLNDSQPKYFACSAAIAPVAAKALDQYGKIQERYSFGDAEGFQNFSTLLQEPATAFTPPPVEAKEDVVLLPYSSGTTGRPKGVMLTHYNLVANLCQFNTELSDVDRPHIAETLISVLPLFHLYGIYACTLYSIYKGNTAVVMPQFDPTAYLKLIQEYKVTQLHIVPPIGLALCRHPERKNFDLSSVYCVLSAAAPMGKELEEEIKHALDVENVKQGYGLSETSPLITMSPQNHLKYGSAGKLVANTEVKLVDGDGKSLPKNENGELWIRGPQVMKGYLNKPEATAETVDSEGWLHTGDVAYYDEHEDFYIVDRLKELIKYKGLQVAPAELEALLISHPGVADVAVIGVPDEKAGELPKAYVVPKPNVTITEEELKQFVEDNLAPYKKLRGGVEFRTSIPKSPSGKILRRLLRDELKS